MSKFAQDIILKPIITEASMIGAANEDGKRKYTFKVALGSTKPEIAWAVKELFKVDVEKVNTINMSGKKRRYGRYEGYTSKWKKAVVTLADDSKSIEFFDGMM